MQSREASPVMEREDDDMPNQPARDPDDGIDDGHHVPVVPVA